ncbi:hypothetical protein M514_09531, partial [Trichuris suis]
LNRRPTKRSDAQLSCERHCPALFACGLSELLDAIVRILHLNHHCCIRCASNLHLKRSSIPTISAEQRDKQTYPRGETAFSSKVSDGTTEWPAAFQANGLSSVGNSEELLDDREGRNSQQQGTVRLLNIGPASYVALNQRITYVRSTGTWERKGNDAETSDEAATLCST